eukprot:scaffold217_cov377-Prasinococcus_capsulatus_cf.AAC.15
MCPWRGPFPGAAACGTAVRGREDDAAADYGQHSHLDHVECRTGALPAQHRRSGASKCGDGGYGRHSAEEGGDWRRGEPVAGGAAPALGRRRW